MYVSHQSSKIRFRKRSPNDTRRSLERPTSSAPSIYTTIDPLSISSPQVNIHNSKRLPFICLGDRRGHLFRYEILSSSQLSSRPFANAHGRSVTDMAACSALRILGSILHSPKTKSLHTDAFGMRFQYCGGQLGSVTSSVQRAL